MNVFIVEFFSFKPATMQADDETDEDFKKRESQIECLQLFNKIRCRVTHNGLVADIESYRFSSKPGEKEKAVANLVGIVSKIITDRVISEIEL
jgi:hypothetical protein